MNAVFRSGPRAVGRRIGFRDLPECVTSWMTEQFGSLDVVVDHVGGMSPGCATTLATSGGRLVFIKAVGAEPNPQTPTLFRTEIQLLHRLATVPYRPVLLAAYDDGEWVALVLEHVAGRYPDLASDEDFAAVAAVVQAQIAELTPPPAGIQVTALAATAVRWIERWSEMSEAPHRFLPAWVADRFDDLRPRVTNLPSRLPETALCHFDVRDDNLLIRGDGHAVVLDWGMARLGPEWTDLVLLAAQKPTPGEAQVWLDRWVPPEERETVTSLLVAFGGSQAWNCARTPRPGLPAFAAFAREDAYRLLAIARLRL